MFSKGNWAVFGFDPATLPAFEVSFGSSARLLQKSQWANSEITRRRKLDTYGINPFYAPRLDETYDEHVSPNDQDEFSDAVMRLAGLEDITDTDLWDATVNFPFDPLQFFGSHGTACYKVTDTLYGFWFVMNRWKDIKHVASRKEGMAYETANCPYKFLDKDSKRDVDGASASAANVERKQFPVLIDTQTRRVYLEATGKNEIESLQTLLETMGLRVLLMAWKFGVSDWVEQFLSKVVAESHYKTDFQKRADDVKTFSDEEREPIEDREVAKLVSTFFASAELDSSQWASLKAPAAIKLFPATHHGISVQTPTDATILLGTAPETSVTGATVVFQERVTYTKKGEESVFRKDLFMLDVNGGINQTEQGVALLHGFEVPSFKSRILREIKKTKKAYTIPEFWRMWRDELNGAITDFTGNVRDTLQLDANAEVGLVALYETGDNSVMDGDDNDEVLRTRIRNGEITLDVNLAAL